ncbi:hypothetical protein [Mesorhizobium sp. WSM2239]|uniref:Flagellar FliJ protein n=2 Tax=unclassified Mesorhizobium TaxID=325217 RepID=A0AAU8DBQ1_9HYPH
MTTRKERLRKLVTVQEQLKALHETRHAGFVSAAAAAGHEAAELAARFDAQESMSVLFPEVYNRRIGQALARQEQNLLLAREEVDRIATATARTNMVERAYRDVRRQDDRDSADRERLEVIERKRPGE